MVILLSLCSSPFRKDLSGWLSFKGNLCNQRFLYCSKIKYNAYNSELYCALRKTSCGWQSDPHYQRYSKLSRVWSCMAPCLCLQLLKPLGMACLQNGGGTLELHEFLLFSKCFLTNLWYQFWSTICMALQRVSSCVIHALQLCAHLSPHLTPLSV